MLKVKDGLGLCRLCLNFDASVHSDIVNIGSEEYFDALCLYYKKPCFLVRKSLLTCNSFKSFSKPKKISFVSRLARGIRKIFARSL